MRVRMLLGCAAVVVVGGISGCDCAGCSAKEVASAGDGDWSVTLSCESSTRVGAVGAAHAGGIIYPDGCDVAWTVKARGRSKNEAKIGVSGPTSDDHACSRTKAFCKAAKGTVVSRREGDDVVAAASAGVTAQGVYIFEPGGPLTWPSSAESTHAQIASQWPAVIEARASGDAARLLAALPSAEDLLTKMLAGAIPIDERAAAALVGPRLDRKLGEVRNAIARCLLPHQALPEIGRQHPELAEDIYASALSNARPCRRYMPWLREAALAERTAKSGALAPRVTRDLQACDPSCDPTRLAELASLAEPLASRDAIALLARHLEAPSAADWKLDSARTRDAYKAWYTSAYAVAQHDPATARASLVRQMGAASTRPLHGADTREDDALEQEDPEGEDRDGGALEAGTKRDAGTIRDAGTTRDAGARDAGAQVKHDPREPSDDGVPASQLPLRKASMPGARGSWAVTVRDMASLLLLVDDPSVRAAMLGFAQDAKRDRGVRQIAIGYLVAVRDPRHTELLPSAALTDAQRRALTKAD